MPLLKAEPVLSAGVEDEEEFTVLLIKQYRFNGYVGLPALVYRLKPDVQAVATFTILIGLVTNGSSSMIYDLTSGIMAPYMFVPSDVNENTSREAAAEEQIGATPAVHLNLDVHVKFLLPVAS